MSVWSVFLNVVFVAALGFNYWMGRRMEANGEQASRGDYIVAVLFGLSGVMSFATSTNAMVTSPVRGWTDAIIGLAALSVSIWSLTLYKKLKSSY